MSHGFLRRRLLSRAVLDADTAVNVSNLELLCRCLASGAGACTLAAASGATADVEQWPATASRGTFNLGVDRLDKRYDVAQYIEGEDCTAPATPSPPTIPPSPGGGPGLIFSRGLLAAVRPAS